MRSPGLGVGQEESGLRSLEELSKKAQELKEKGMSTYEISDELKVQADTVVWLLLHGRDAAKPRGESYDVYVNWNPIGSSVRRLTLVGQAIADMVRESIEAGEIEEPDVVAGIETAAMAIALIVARSLGKPMAAIRPQRIGEKKMAGAVNPSFYPVEGKKVLIVDTILRMGETARAAIETLEAVKARPVGIAVLANKSGKEKIEGIPLRSLVELLPVARQ
ncbi:orotate phosphoribosyltransferase-like protein [Candidatus Bathyarchaeota archaeon]|nr:MAG: orotate phosphoribosyltransferase-like protein [Candidatus Bathyarchaeota archaeon]